MKECMGLFSMGKNLGNMSHLAAELGINNTGFLRYLSDETQDPYLSDPHEITIRNASRTNPSGFTDNYGFGEYMDLVTRGPENDTMSILEQGSRSVPTYIRGLILILFILLYIHFTQLKPLSHLHDQKRLSVHMS